MGSERHLLDHELQQFVERWHIINGSELESIAKKFEDKAVELRCNRIKTIKISDAISRETAQEQSIPHKNGKFKQKACKFAMTIL